jgi:hypothetical protein
MSGRRTPTWSRRSRGGGRAARGGARTIPDLVSDECAIWWEDVRHPLAQKAPPRAGREAQSPCPGSAAAERRNGTRSEQVGQVSDAQLGSTISASTPIPAEVVVLQQPFAISCFRETTHFVVYCRSKTVVDIRLVFRLVPLGWSGGSSSHRCAMEPPIQRPDYQITGRGNQV